MGRCRDDLMRTQVDESEIRDGFWLLVMIVLMNLEPSESWSRVQRGVEQDQWS